MAKKENVTQRKHVIIPAETFILFNKSKYFIITGAKTKNTNLQCIFLTPHNTNY